MNAVLVLLVAFAVSCAPAPAFANVVGPQIPSQAGKAGDVLSTNGSILQWIAGGGGGGTPGGANTAVQYNNAGAFGGDTANFNYVSGTQTLTVSGNVATGNLITPSIQPQSGNALNVSTTGANANVSLVIGAGSPQGQFQFNEVGVGSTSGQVWTANDTIGHGYWADASGGGGGANTALSNLVSTSVNASLIPAGVLSLGQTANPWSQIWLGGGAPGLYFTNNSSLQPSADTFLFVDPSGQVSIQAGNSTHRLNYTNGQIAIDFTTSGNLLLGNEGLAWPTADGSAGQVLRTDGAANLSFSGGTTGTICGWKDVTVTVNCNGSDPSVSCPTGFTQKIGTTVTFCAAN